MKNCVYTLYNRLSRRYGDVVCYPTDDFALSVLKRSMPQANLNFNEFELCRIGELDIETGVLAPCNPVRVAWNFPGDSDLPVKESE